MIIRRIKKISQVGVFSDFNGSQHQFDKLTIIYGLNTYGKSTLCDVFQSLSKNKPELIIDRRTIPNSSNPQKVEISVSDDHNSSERSIKYESSSWQLDHTNLDIEVLGTSFIHENVFTGLTFDRSNKENFTDFILGAEGVKLANEIEELKKKRRDKNAEFRYSIPAFVKDKSQREIDSFISLKIGEPLEQIKKIVDDKLTGLRKEQSILTQRAEIISKQEPSKVSFNGNLIKKTVRSINDFLEKSFESLDKDAIEKIMIHLTENTKNATLANIWLKQGIDIQKEGDNNCPFCGQNLNQVKELISAYHSYFSDEYEKYTTVGIGTLQQCMELIESIELNIHNSLLSNLAILKEYENLISESRFKETFLKYEELVNRFQVIEAKVKKSYQDFVKSLKAVVKQKEQAPQSSMTAFDYNKTAFRNQLLSIYYTELRKAQKLLTQLIMQIQNFKAGLLTDKIAQEIQQMEAEIFQLQRKCARVEQDKSCENYKRLTKEFSELEVSLANAQKTMAKTQNKYVDTYFEKTDEVFKKLGSHDFKLIKEDNRLGDKKVYGVSVLFKGKLIPKDKISVIFSESDRRALAMSIFIAKILLKSPDELNKSIIILDDPSTSFDDNRISSTINLIADLSQKTAQTIILTHYPIFIRRLFELQKQAKLFEIVKSAATCELASTDKDTFCQSEHEKCFDKVMCFIRRETQDDPRREIRVFFENQLKAMFLKQVLEYDLQNVPFKQLLDALKDKNIISSETFAALNKYREFLNPEHHGYSSANIEDIRSQANEIMEFLFAIDFQN